MTPPPNDVPRLVQIVERLADQVRDDLRDVDRKLERSNDRLDEALERLERLERNFRRAEPTVPVPFQAQQTGPIPIPIRDATSQPMALRVDDTQPKIHVPTDWDMRPITADNEKLVLRWTFLGTVWRWGRWVALPTAGAAIHWIVDWFQHLK